MLYKFAASFYKYCQDQKLEVPYFRTIILLSFLLFIHLAQITIIFHIPPDKMFFWGPIKSKFIQRIMAAVYFLGIGWLLSLIFRKSRLEEEAFTEVQLKRWQLIVLWYIIVSFVLLAALLIKSGIDRGLIKI